MPVKWDDEAQTRILRAMVLVFAIATVVFGTLGIPSIETQMPLMVPWWSWAAVLGFFGVPIAMALFARWSRAATIKRWAAAIAIIQVVILVTWVPFQQVAELPANANSPWVLGVTALGTSAAAMAWRGRYLWIFLLVTGVLVVLDRTLTSSQPVATPYLDGLYAVTFSAVFATLASVCVHAGAELDRVATAVQREAAAEATHRAENLQRSRMNALLHDQVLVTLLVASDKHPELQQVAALQAQRTVTQITRFGLDVGSVDELSGRDAAWQLQAVATETDPNAAFSYEVTEDAAVVPADVVQALGEGLAEALRNVVRHAGEPGRDLDRAVHVQISADGARVDVLDDGRGFDPALVAPARLGIVVSIRERMASLAGGSSDVVSVPGQGTRVLLQWAR